jgi:hypothetical protein
VVERLIEQAGVEACPEVETLHVADLEPCGHALGGGSPARDLDHLRRDVVPDRVDALAGGEERHPAGAAAELAQPDAGTQVEELQHVAEVDQVACGVPRVVDERLRLEPPPAIRIDVQRVVALGLFASVAHGG